MQAAAIRSPVRNLLLGGLLTGLGAMLGAASLHIDIRLLLFLSVLGAVGLGAIRYRGQTAVLVMLLLPFLELVRRLLIPLTGWQHQDPLLLIAPAVALFLAFSAFWEGRIHWRMGGLTTAVSLFTLWMGMEAFNPSGGLAANLVGGLFVLVPLFWFFVGRAYGSECRLRVVFAVMVVEGVGISLYGLRQTLSGLPPWDAAWVRAAGFAALNVGGVIRAFGTFPSSAEYALFLSLGIVILFSWMVRTALPLRPFLLIPVALLGVAVFLDSGRSVIVTTLAATGLLWAVGASSPLRVWGRLLVAFGATVVFYLWLVQGHHISGSGGGITPLLSHQVNGLSQPFNNKYSTLNIHIAMVVNGFLRALHHPVGYGLGAVNLAGASFGGVTAGTEIDISNAFVAGGIPGGLLFLGIYWVAWRTALQEAMQAKRWVRLAAVGILLGTFGQWLNGGEYTVSAVLWYTLGTLDRFHRESAEMTLKPGTEGSSL